MITAATIRLRIEVLASDGIDHAQVVEVRPYNQKTP
jgi:hypothetical protein